METKQTAVFTAAPMTMSNVAGRLGERVLALRSRQRLSPWELAGNLGITCSHLEDIERGYDDVDLLMLAALSCEFGLTLSDLLHGM